MPLAVAERLRQGQAQRQRAVLDRMVAVDMQIAARLHGQVEQAVDGDVGEHMVEEAHAGRDLVRAAAIQAQPHKDIGLVGGPVDLGDSHKDILLPIKIQKLSYGILGRLFWPSPER